MGFDGDNVDISIESDYAVRGPDGQEERFATAPAGAAPLLDLLGATVAAAGGTTDGTLTVEFDSGATLTVFESDRPYESYQLHFGEALIVVRSGDRKVSDGWTRSTPGSPKAPGQSGPRSAL